jgi:predicted HTH transcriptional regulator
VGKPESLREWRTRHLIDYRLVPSDAEADQRWEDRVPWEGNLLSGFETIYPRLTAPQATPFRLEGGTRVDEGPGRIALREALVNLLVHADFAETQASLIQQSPAGYLFRNPGSSRVPEADLMTGDRSDPRNPQLVRMFRLIGLADEAGTGIPKIVRFWRELGFLLPAIDAGTERYEFTLKLHHAHLLSDEDRLWLRSLGETWSESEQLALVLARHEGAVDNLTLRRLSGQHPADVTKLLGSLRTRELLQMIGGGRGARYQLGPAAVGGMPTTGEPSSGNLEPSSGNLEPSSGNLEPSSGSSEANSGDLSRDLEEIARPAREQRYLRTEALSQILVQLCARCPLSLRQLAELVGRSDERVRPMLRSLVASGHLAYVYPDQPRHPQQKYLAKLPVRSEETQ